MVEVENVDLLEETVDGEGQEAATENNPEVKQPTAEELKAALDAAREREEHLKKQLDDKNGAYGGEKATRALLQKMLKKFDGDGLVDRDEVAAEFNLERRRLDGLIDSDPEENAMVRKAKVVDKQLVEIAPALKVLGYSDDDIKTSQDVYATLLQYDKTEQEAFTSVPDDQVAAYVIKRAKEIKDRVEPIVASGGNVLAVVDQYKKKIAELEAKLAAGSKDSESFDEPREKTVIGGGSAPSGIVRVGKAGSFYDSI